MQHAYSWNGTRIHLVVEDKVAEAYNRAFDHFLAAQRNFRSMTGRMWAPEDGRDLLYITWDEEEMKAWNDVAAIVNAIVELNSGSIEIEGKEMCSNYLKRVYDDEGERRAKDPTAEAMRGKPSGS